MRIRQILSENHRELITAPADCLIPEASRRLATNNIGILIVVDAANGPIGIISERDIARACADRISRLAFMPVSEIMTLMIHTCGPDDTLEEVKDRAITYQIRHLPVIENGVLIDMLSMRDILNYEVEALKNDQRLLLDTEAKFRQVVDVSPNGIYVQIGGSIIYANASLASYFDATTPTDLIGRESNELFDPEYIDEINQRHTLTEGSGDTSVNVKCLRLDGSSFDAEVSGRQVVWDGEPAVMVIIHDITSKIDAEQNLRASEERFRRVVDIALEAVISIDLDGNIQLFNQGAEAIFGYSATDVIGEPLDRLLPERFRHEHGGHVRQFTHAPEVSHRMDQRRTIYGLRKDGSEFPAEASISKLDLPGGTALTVMLRDITKRKRAQDELLKNEERYRLIVDQSPEAAYISVDHKLVFANRAYLAQVRANSLDDVLGRDVREFIHPDDKQIIPVQRRLLLERGVPLDPIEVRRLRLDGTEYPAESTLAPMVWDREPAVQVVCRDITLRKQAEEAMLAAKEEAELANRTKSEFLASMSHELRTPLNAIIGFSQILAQEGLQPVENTEHRDYARHIQTAGQHLLSLINDVLDTSKIEAGKVELQEETVDIGEIIKSGVTLIKERAHTGGVSLMTDISDHGIPLLRADPRRLKQILVNLLSNAVKFTEVGGTVTIKVWHNPDSGFVLQVIDTGIGIAVDDIPKALARFQQIDGALNRQFEGTGLGLPLTKSLVELHGGSLDLQSQVGIGTTVTVRLPSERIVELAA